MPLLAAAAFSAAIAGCGDSGSGPTPRSTPTAPSAASFPTADGTTLQELMQGVPEGPILAPSVSELTKGRPSRFGFGLFDTARRPIKGAQVALYTSATDGSNVRGPYPARAESLITRPQFRAKTTADDPDAATQVYVAEIPFRATGQQAVLGLARLDGRMVTLGPVSVKVSKRGDGPPAPGDKAPVIHTPTVAEAGGDLSKIDTRIPPAPDLHRADLADVLGRKPAVLIFATPALCQSRVCGPVVDVALEVADKYRGKVVFIHQEIYNGNEISKGFRPQLVPYRLESEPWAFVIDRHGRISDRLEGAFSVSELDRAVAKIAKG